MTRIKKTNILFRQAKQFPLNEKFLRFFRQDLANYVKANPAPPKFFLKKIFSVSAIPAAAAVVLFIFLGGLVGALASAKTVPGDLLYPIKIAGEELKAVFIAPGKPKADFRIKQAYTRINEIKDLQKKAAQTAKKAEEKNGFLMAKASQQFNSHIKGALDQTRSLKEKDKLPEASAVNERLAVSLKFYKKILEKEEDGEFKKSGENDKNKGQAPAEINSLIKAAENFEAEAAKEQAEVKKQEFNNFPPESAVQEKITAAASDIKNIEALIRPGKISEAVANKAAGDLEKARSKLNEAKEKFAKEDLSGAFAKAQDALEITRKIRAFMETALMIEQEKSDEALSQIKDILLAEEENQAESKDKDKGEERDEKSGEKSENRGKN